MGTSLPRNNLLDNRKLAPNAQSVKRVLAVLQPIFKKVIKTDISSDLISQHNSNDLDIDYSPLTIYLNAIGKFARISAKQEIQLAKRIQQGDSQAREIMIQANLKLVVKIAQDYSHLGVPVLDLIEEGNIGLMKAVERFDPLKGNKLSTYAAWWIKQAVKRALTNQGKTIRIPLHMVERISQIRKTKYNLEIRLRREPTAEEIALEMKMPVKKVVHLLAVSIRPSSLQMPINEYDSKTLGDTIHDESAITPAQGLDSKSMFSDLNVFMAALSQREYEILRLRFGFADTNQMTLEEIGTRLHITRERVRQIQDEVLGKFRKFLVQRETELTHESL